MSRLSHKKSRKGCQKCKQRHVKCDEIKPACLKCVAGELRCPYLDNASSPLTPASIASPSSSILTPASSSSIPESTVTPTSHGVLNMLHLELLYHANSPDGLNAIFFINSASFELIMKETYSHAFSTPYLMHALLSLSAQHLSVLRPLQKDFYAFHSTELQTHALSLFNTTTINESSDFLPPFLFASLIGSHLLHGAISPSNSDDDFSSFLAHFVNYLRIAKGVTAQLSAAKWIAFQSGPFGAFVESGNLIPPISTAAAPELDTLESLLQTADISPNSLEVYMLALKNLKASYQAQKVGVSATGISALFAWPIKVGSEYTDLLEQRRPEALVILAYFAVLLWEHRGVWVFGDGGRRVLRFVGEYLGPSWDRWLEFPRSIVEGS